MALERLLRPIVDIRKEESRGVLLMFFYSFLAMTAYNIVQPITRSRFISALGAENLPYVLLVSVFIIGIIMQGYSKLGNLLPARWIIPATQAIMVGLLLGFWTLFGSGDWVEVGFYLFGQIYGLLLISQFWTLANLVFDPRQAKRIFGFIGGGASLGGIAGGSITAFLTDNVGNRQLVLVSAIVLAVCAAVVILITSGARNEELRGLSDAGKEEGVGGQEALRLLRTSRHLQIIAGVIALTSIAAGIVDQQLNMATEAFKGPDGTDAMAQVLAQVQVWVSVIGFIIQVWLTSRIQRYLGVGFALLLLPVSFSATAVMMLLNYALWAPVSARIVDKALRYTVDKTTREILFLPLPSDIKQKAKPFVDVTVDRFARAIQALLVLVLIAPWGLNLDWQRLSIASLFVTACWIAMALVAKRGYIRAFRNSIERRDVLPADVRLNVADLQTVETLIEELADPDENRVLYAIDILESLDKRNLITPLLLYHESSRVRCRALEALGSARQDVAERWLPHVQRMLQDTDTDVRVSAMSALANIRESDVAEIVRPYLENADGRLASSAAMVLARTGNDAADISAAEATLVRLAAGQDASLRSEVAAAVRGDVDPRVHHVLIPLLYDNDPQVAEDALESVRKLGTTTFLFVPTLVALLRNRRLKGPARDVLVGYGPEVVPALAHFLRDPDEDAWVRRHIPATLARIPSQASMDALVAALGDNIDGFLRFKLLTAINRLHGQHPELTFDRKPLEAIALQQANSYFNWLGLHYNLFVQEKLPSDSLLAHALTEKIDRATNRVWVLLGILFKREDVAAARWAIQKGNEKARSSALEYLDNLLTGAVRKRVVPVLEDTPLEEKVRRGNALLSTRPRGVEDTLLQLINDDDQIVAAAAIQFVARQTIWSLAPDIEHVLAHRDARDWFVFEAASWALAEQRMPPERVRQLWLEPLPAVELASRLRTLPVFSGVSVDELFRIAGCGRQSRYEPGSVLGSEGQAPTSIEFLLEGTVEARTRTGAAATLAPVSPIGLDEVLTGTPFGATLRAASRAVCLNLLVEEWNTLLADNADLVQGLFKTVLQHAAFGRDCLIMEGGPDAGTAMSRLTAEGISPVEKVLAMESVAPFAQVSADDLLQLANATQRITFTKDQKVQATPRTASVLIVIDGQLTLTANGTEPLIAKSGDVVGLLESLAGVPLGRDVVAVTDGILLRAGHDELMDVLGERPGLLRQLLARLFGGRTVNPVAVS